MLDSDILVIGAGPAGLSAATECAYHGLGKVLALEKGKTHNQTVYQYYPDDKRVDAAYKGQEAVCAGVLCFRDTTKVNFLAVIDEMLSAYPFPIQYETTVDSVKKGPDGNFSVSTTAGKSVGARFVVLAIGRMGKPNRPEYFNSIPAGARKLISFDIKGLEATGKSILVVGGGNSAVEFALALSSKGKVTLSYRQAAFHRLNPMNLTLLEAEEKAGRIEILRNSGVENISEQSAKPNVHFAEGSPRVFDQVVFGIGGSSPAAFLQNAGIELDAKGNPVLRPGLETSVPGLFVAGELSVPSGKGSIIVSFNSGKVIADTIAKRLGLSGKPEIVHYAR